MTHADAVVVGGGIGGLNAAHTLARLGLAPLLLETRGGVGGLVFGGTVGGVRVDLGAESFAKRSGAVAALCRDLGLPVVDPAGRSWLWSPGATDAADTTDDQPETRGGAAFPIPDGVLGIPASLDDPVLPRALSAAGLARARADLALGAATGSDAADLATLVAARLGTEVLDRLVAPVAGGIHSAHPSRLAVDVVAPGLREALAREGSLVGAAAALRAASPAGAVVSSVEGGLFRLPAALAARTADLGGTVATRRVVTAIARHGAGWQVTHHAAGPGPDPAGAPRPTGDPETVTTDRLVVALDGRAALDVLRPLPDLAVGDWRLPPGADVTHVCVVLAEPALDAAPRGSGLLVAAATEDRPGRVACKALTHYSAKWPAVVAGTGAHVLRLSYGRGGAGPGDPAAPAAPPTLARALADASVLLGLPLTADRVRGHAVVRFPDALPPPTPSHRARVAELAAGVDSLPGLAVTGAWVAGAGLAGVLPHAEASARGLAA